MDLGLRGRFHDYYGGILGLQGRFHDDEGRISGVQGRFHDDCSGILGLRGRFHDDEGWNLGLRGKFRDDQGWNSGQRGRFHDEYRSSPRGGFWVCWGSSLATERDFGTEAFPNPNWRGVKYLKGVREGISSEGTKSRSKGGGCISSAGTKCQT